MSSGIISKEYGYINRRSIRLKGFDYTKSGAYFVTICAYNRELRFGNISDGKMLLNDAGKMINTVWNEIPFFYPGIDIDACQIMPNHFHGIIIIAVGAGPRACPEAGQRSEAGQQSDTGHSWNTGQPQGVAPKRLSLPDVVHRFKTMTTKKYIDGVKNCGWPSFDGKLWQRNYYEHIMRNENELNMKRKYIINNPLKWIDDENNPDNINTGKS
jgi:putative transposase